MERIERVHSHLCNGSSSKDGQLSGKACVITGAGSGIGRASAVRFAREGGLLVCADWNEQGVEETVQIIQKQGGKAVAMKCDVGDEKQVEQLIELCCSTYGKIDVCFANAGVAAAGPFWMESVETWETLLRVNVIGVFNCFKFAFLKMDQQGTGGSLIGTASVAGIRSGAGDCAYSSSKAAVINMCRVVAQQCTGTNIRCNAICPGLIETGMTKPVFDYADDKGIRKKVGKINPLLRYGEPEEIANAALFLASDESSYINGQALPVCGGLSSSHPVVRNGKGLST